MQLPASLSAFIVLVPALVTSYTFDCDHVRVDKTSYDFTPISGPHSISIIDRDQPPAISNRTWTINLCGSMTPVKGIPSKDQCPEGTRVCGIENETNDNVTNVVHVIPVARNDQNNGLNLDPKWSTIPKAEDSESWAANGGIELILNGGSYGGKSQKAIVDFVCDPKKTGNEGNEDAAEMGKGREVDDKLVRRDEGDGIEKEKEKDKELADANSLKFVSYGPEEDEDKKKEINVLRLQWYTKVVCRAEEPNLGSSGWGFFTWFILILFMGTASYLIFGSWLNYNRYGARGWDLLPHGDTIRDIPYLFRDWTRKVVDTVQGVNYSRQGYSAV